ncbi:MAG: 4Fe-4S binding protein [Bacteroidales bacterium]|nr:4Fe-4S binding protein [Bacteroidales bacterium]
MVSKHSISFVSFIITLSVLAIIHLKIDPPMLLLERFYPGYGWIEIILLASWAAFLTKKMQNPKEVFRWRKISWLIFSVVFFSQLLLGLGVDERFLMTGKLHLPVPAMILSGPVYRFKISFMPILFISTIILTGPAWCSHLCYFGALDNLAASGKSLRKVPLKNKMKYKHLILFTVISFTIILRIFNVPVLYATILGIAFGMVGFIGLGRI